MKNYKDSEKKFENVLKKLNLMSNKVVKMNNHINITHIKQETAAQD